MKRRSHMKLGLGAVGIAAALVLSGCASGGGTSPDTSSGSGGKLTPITLQLQWTAQAQFAGSYAALAQGFYKKAG
ncbi:MAG: ABC transporter substrate-binding protein, partial [Pseudolysinimonas sp.]